MRKQCGGTPAGSTSSVRVLAAGRPPDETQTIRPDAVTVFGGYLRVPGGSPSGTLSDSVGAAPRHGIAVRLRMGVASLAVGLVSVLGAPSAVHAAHSVSAPIQPGAPACISNPLGDVDGQPIICGTLGFVLKDQRGGRYITATAHGYTKGDRAYGQNDCCDPEAGGFGEVVIDDDSQDVFHPSANHDPAEGSDIALIRIDNDKHGSLSPSFRYWTGPTGVAGTGDGKPNDLLYIHDFNSTTSGNTPAHDPSPRMARLTRPDIINNNNFFYDLGLYDGEPYEIGGASGAPFLLAANGKALGLNGNCHCGTATFGYPTLDYVLRRFSSKYGYSDLELVTAPYHPPPPPERN